MGGACVHKRPTPVCWYGRYDGPDWFVGLLQSRERLRWEHTRIPEKEKRKKEKGGVTTASCGWKRLEGVFHLAVFPILRGSEAAPVAGSRSSSSSMSSSEAEQRVSACGGLVQENKHICCVSQIKTAETSAVLTLSLSLIQFGSRALLFTSSNKLI